MFTEAKVRRYSFTNEHLLLNKGGEMANKGTRDNPLTREDVGSLIRESKSMGKKLNLSGFYFEDHINLRLEFLNGADLSGAHLIGADLSGAELARADLKNANLTGAKLWCRLLNADLRGANLSGADLLGAFLLGADLRGANLSGAKVVGTNLIEDGVDLRGAIMPNGSKFPL